MTPTRPSDAVVSGCYRDAIDFPVAWLDAESHLLVEPDRALVHRGRHRPDQASAPCLGGGEEALVELPANAALRSAGWTPG